MTDEELDQAVDFYEQERAEKRARRIVGRIVLPDLMEPGMKIRIPLCEVCGVPGTGHLCRSCFDWSDDLAERLELRAEEADARRLLATGYGASPEIVAELIERIPW